MAHRMETGLSVLCQHAASRASMYALPPLSLSLADICGALPGLEKDLAAHTNWRAWLKNQWGAVALLAESQFFACALLPTASSRLMDASPTPCGRTRGADEGA